MSARRQNFSLHAGDYRDITVTVLDAGGSPVDLTSATIAWKLTTALHASPALLSKAVASGITIPVQTTNIGEFVIALASADTSSLAPGVYYHEADVTIGSKKSTVIYGNVTIKLSVV